MKKMLLGLCLIMMSITLFAQKKLHIEENDIEKISKAYFIYAVDSVVRVHVDERTKRVYSDTVREPMLISVHGIEEFKRKQKFKNVDSTKNGYGIVYFYTLDTSSATAVIIELNYKTIHNGVVHNIVSGKRNYTRKLFVEPCEDSPCKFILSARHGKDFNVYSNFAFYISKGKPEPEIKTRT